MSLRIQQLVFSGGDDTDSRVVDITAEDNTTRVLMDLGDLFRNEAGDLVDDDPTPMV